MTTLFETELREQPATLERLLTQGREKALAIADRIRTYQPHCAVIAARGSSDNAARYGQYLFGIQNQLLASLATPSLFTQYHAAPSLAGALVVGISQSGQSPDIVAVIEEARRQRALTLAVTNEEGSPLAAAAELVLPLLAGAERAVAATKTYTAQALALAMLSAALRNQDPLWAELGALPERVARTIDANAGCLEWAHRYAGHDRLIVVGRGYNLSTALEITLKIKETSGIMADGYSSADFFHGPKAILDRNLPVLAVAPGRVFEELDGVIRLAQEKGSPLVVLSDRREILEAADVALSLPTGTPEWLSPIAAVVPGQLWALGLSLARGADPDRPPGLSKVTETR